MRTNHITKVSNKTDLPEEPPAFCFWNVGGRQWIFQSREPKVSSVLRKTKGFRPYARSMGKAHLEAWTGEFTPTKARSIARSATRVLTAFLQGKGHAGSPAQAFLLAGCYVGSGSRQRYA